MKKFQILLIIGFILMASISVLADPYSPPANPWETKSIVLPPDTATRP